MPPMEIGPIAEKFMGRARSHFPLEGLLGAPPTEAGAPQGSGFNRQRLPSRKRALLYLLSVAHWGCLLAFALSYLPWFQTAATLPLAGIWAQVAAKNTLALDGLVRILSVSGLIGFGTNYIAIRMLFRPLQRRPVWGQGLIPAQREVIIRAFAHGIHKFILSQELITARLEKSGVIRRLAQVLTQGAAALLEDDTLKADLADLALREMDAYLARPEVRAEIRQTIDAKIAENLDTNVKRFVVQTYKRLNRDKYEATLERLIAQLPGLVRDALIKLDPEVLRLAAALRTQDEPLEKALSEALAALLYRIDIARLLAGQMSHFDEARLEAMILSATNEQLNYIQYLGTVLGILGGLLIWEPRLMLAGGLLLFALLYAIDAAVFAYWQRRTPPPHAPSAPPAQGPE